jgi:hypothetical protein
MTPSTSQLLKWRIAPGVVILLVAGAASWFYFRPPPPAPGVLQVGGRVEGDLAAVGSKSGGRIGRPEYVGIVWPRPFRLLVARFPF